MKLEQFIELVKTPAQVGEEHISSIEKILSDYPYFQTAHLLYAKALQSSNHINFRNALKKTAVVAGSRTVLYRLIQLPNEIVKIEIPKEEVKQIQIEKVEKTISNVSITYDVVPTIKSEKTEVIKDVEVKNNVISSEVEKQEIKQIEIVKQETLEEVILKPVLEAYVDTEVLKVTEKETVETAEKSFTDWLKTVADHTPVTDNSLKSIERQKETLDEPKKIKSKTEKQQLLDKLINEDMHISRVARDKDFSGAVEKSKSSVIENEDLVTETLAKIYRIQGNNSKAIRAYEILSLKFPEKSAYFASLIQEIKNSLK